MVTSSFPCMTSEHDELLYLERIFKNYLKFFDLRLTEKTTRSFDARLTEIFNNKVSVYCSKLRVFSN